MKYFVLTFSIGSLLNDGFPNRMIRTQKINTRRNLLYIDGCNAGIDYLDTSGVIVNPLKDNAKLEYSGGLFSEF